MVWISRVRPNPRAKTATRVTTAVAERRMPPRVTPSRIVVQKSAIALGRAPQVSARIGSAARVTRAPTTIGARLLSSSAGAVGLDSRPCADLLRRSKTTCVAPSRPMVSAVRMTRKAAAGRIAEHREDRPRDRDEPHQPHREVDEAHPDGEERLAVVGAGAVLGQRLEPGALGERRHPPEDGRAEQHRQDLQRALGGDREVPAQRQPGEEKGERDRDAEREDEPRRLARLVGRRAGSGRARGCPG